MAAVVVSPMPNTKLNHAARQSGHFGMRTNSSPGAIQDVLRIKVRCTRPGLAQEQEDFMASVRVQTYLELEEEQPQQEAVWRPSFS